MMAGALALLFGCANNRRSVSEFGDLQVDSGDDKPFKSVFT